MIARRFRPAFALLAALAAPAAGRADNLDAGLIGEVWEVQNFLTEHKVKNVGVLNFRVKKGGGPKDGSFSLGTLPTTMPVRLETALIASLDPNKGVGVIHDASATAAKTKAAWYTHKADREKLFAVTSYPLAWGSQQVRPDALLTGLVTVAADLAHVDVTVEAILRTAPDKLQQVCTFKVPTDRALLRELGQSYAVPRNAMAATRSARDKQAVANALRRDQAPTDDLSPDNVCGLKFEVLYNDAAQTPRRDDRSPGEWRVDPPQPGQKVAFRVSNAGQGDGRLGATIYVNGRSLWQQLTGPADDATGIWLFDRGDAPTVFNGFFTSAKGENLIPFKVLTEQEAADREPEFGERVGTIDVEVFASRPGGQPEAETLTISRSLTKKGAAKPRTLTELQTNLLKSNPLLKKAEAAARSGKRNLITGDEAAITGPEIKSAELPDRKPVGRLTIRYYDPKGSGAMQISN